MPPTAVFDAVAAELDRLIGADGAVIDRYEADGTITVLASSGSGLPVGTRGSLEGSPVSAQVWRTGRSVRVNSYAGGSGPLAEQIRGLGIRSAVGAPIAVEGRLWGLTVAFTTREEPMAADAEARIADFTDLVGTAIANAQARADLVASRTRVVIAADQARRRIERDLHDGIQQRLVSLAVAARMIEADLPSGTSHLRARLSALTDGLTAALDELREISRGIHPAILSDGGLGPALKSLARRSAVAVQLDVCSDRLPEPVEVAGYYVVAEALANATKYAHAAVVHVATAVSDGRLHITVRDHGVGGADPACGSGLTGLADRVEALGGTITLDSPIGHGTSLHVELPLAVH
ncbi:GAF domain-containing sensor histidine kinase [Dactylosporangium sp. CA-052675]|uniref:GAF domain-containing sensor histidine kinase n=1 Tax=Dactylosporangium sp. CA-052675 TaxID=3239927 RepID=UPI003D89E5ED